MAGPPTPWPWPTVPPRPSPTLWVTAPAPTPTPTLTPMPTPTPTPVPSLGEVVSLPSDFLLHVSAYVLAAAFVLAVFRIFSNRVVTNESRAFWFLSLAVLLAAFGYVGWGWYILALWLVFVFVQQSITSILSVFRG